MDEDNGDHIGKPSKRPPANRRNARLSTGPRTEQGKSRSRLNALQHGILASAVLITKGSGAEDSAEFEQLLDSLHRDLAPVGALEEMLVEKIAVCLWRQKRALKCEAGLVRRAFVPDNPKPFEDLERAAGFGPNPEREAITDHLSVPLGADLDRILRYEATVQRQLAYAIDQLERLQRARKGEHVPLPVSIQVSSDHQS